MRGLVLVVAGIAALGGAAVAQEEERTRDQEELERERPEVDRRGRERIEERELWHVDIGPRFGVANSTDQDDPEFTAGLQARTWVAEIVGIEARAMWFQQEFVDGDVELNNFPIDASVIVSPLPGFDIRPYVLAGAGVMIRDEDVTTGLEEDTETDVDSLLSAGVGVDADVIPNMALNVEARWHWLGNDLGDIADTVANESDELDFWSITGGADLRF